MSVAIDRIFSFQQNESKRWQKEVNRERKKIIKGKKAQNMLFDTHFYFFETYKLSIKSKFMCNGFCVEGNTKTKLHYLQYQQNDRMRKTL